MKKLISLLLIAALLCGAFVSCTGSGNDESEESYEEISRNVVGTSKDLSSGEDESDASGQASGDESKSGESDDENSVGDESNDVSDDESGDESDDRPLGRFKTLVSTGCGYSSSVEASSVYPDSGKCELTDGVYGIRVSDISDSRLAGYMVTSDLSVTVSLNKTESLYSFAASYLCAASDGVSAVAAVTVYSSDDGKSFTKLGNAVKPEYSEKETVSAVLTLDEPVNAKYIKFVITRGGPYIMLDEIMVYADIEGGEIAASKDYADTIANAYKEDSTGDASKQNALKKVTTGKADRSKTRTNVSEGCSYSATYMPDATRYGDAKMEKLTDGKSTGADFADEGSYVRFNDGKELMLTVDLQKTYTSLADFEISLYSRKTVGAYLPIYVEFAVSSDNKSFTAVGRAYAPAETDDENYVFALHLEQTVEGRYVRFTLAETKCVCFMAEELSVFAYMDVDYNTVYPDFDGYDPVEELYWDSSEQNYNVQTNLLLSLSPDITSAAVLDYSKHKDLNTSVRSPLLTDGALSGEGNINDGTWFKFGGGLARGVSFDLTKISAVMSFSVSFAKDKASSVSIPLTVSFLLSTDGVSWYTAYNAFAADIDQSSGVVTISYTLPETLAARYFKIVFDVTDKVYIDEITLTGTKRVRQSYERASDLAKSADSDAAGDMAIIHTSEKDYDTTAFTSLVGGFDSSGRVSSILFGSITMLPDDDLPSGGSFDGAVTKVDCEYVLNSLFGRDKNLLALESALARVNSALASGAGTVTVYVALPCLEKGRISFGDVDGDGESEHLQTLESKQKALEWYIDEFLNRWNECGFTNIKFGGFVRTSDVETRLDAELVKNISTYLHSSGLALKWRTTLASRAFTAWQSLGFDSALFVCESCDIDENIYAADEYGIGISLVLDDTCGSEITSYASLCKALFATHEKGVGAAFTESLVLFAKFRVSGSGTARSVYERVSAYTNGTLVYRPNGVALQTFACKKDAAVSGTLYSSDALSQISLSVSPKHGSVAFGSDGSFTYYPNKGYTGTDSFTFRVGNYLTQSLDCTVILNVK